VNGQIKLLEDLKNRILRERGIEAKNQPKGGKGEIAIKDSVIIDAEGEYKKQVTSLSDIKKIN